MAGSGSTSGSGAASTSSGSRSQSLKTCVWAAIHASMRALVRSGRAWMAASWMAAKLCASGLQLGRSKLELALMVGTATPPIAAGGAFEASLHPAGTSLAALAAGFSPGGALPPVTMARQARYCEARSQAGSTMPT